MVRAGLEDFHFHDLRHTFATRLVQTGVDLYAVKQMMGHKSIKTTERYAHHYPESLRGHVRHLDRVCHTFVIPGVSAPLPSALKSSKINLGSA